MTAEQRATFDRGGYLIIRGALRPDEVAAAREAIDRVYASMAKAGSLGPDGSMHLLSAVANCPEVAGLTDHPATFPYVWSTLGWNIHVYHSHLDVHPPVRAHMPFRFDWHQDGGRQNREIETTPRPRLSVKLAYWLSDVSEPGRGNLKVVPGSHVVNWIDGPPRRDIEWPDPAGAVEVDASWTRTCVALVLAAAARPAVAPAPRTRRCHIGTRACPRPEDRLPSAPAGLPAIPFYPLGQAGNDPP